MEQEQLKVREKDLHQFTEVRLILELYKCPEYSSEYGNLARAMIGIKNLGYDPKAIVAAYKKSENLKKENKKLEDRLRESEKMLESYKRKLDEVKTEWEDNHNALEKFKRLVKDGLTSEVIFRAVHVLENDFQKSDIDQLIEDIRTYGSTSAARRRLQRLD